MEIQQTDRVKHIDYMKACAIILVVLGHAMVLLNNLVTKRREAL